MQPFGQTRARAGGPGALGALLALALLSGCSSAGIVGSSGPQASASGSSSSLSDKFSNLLLGTPTMSGPPTTTAAADGAPSPADIDCPGVEIRQGASTFSQSGADNGSAALSVRYQANFLRSARSCVLHGPNVSMKVGVEGRLILGPAGEPGTVTLPVRLALVREGIQPKTVWTKFYSVPVMVSAGQSNVTFTHVEEDLSFPMPPGNELDQYVIYVGFDPESAPAESRRKPAKAAPKPKAAVR